MSSNERIWKNCQIVYRIRWFYILSIYFKLSSLPIFDIRSARIFLKLFSISIYQRIHVVYQSFHQRTSLFKNKMSIAHKLFVSLTDFLARRLPRNVFTINLLFESFFMTYSINIRRRLLQFSEERTHIKMKMLNVSISTAIKI